MPTIKTDHPMIIRNERGLSIRGTRITIYDIMDGLRWGWSFDKIRSWFRISEEQLAAAIEYIQAHQADCDREYDVAMKEFEDSKKLWDEKHRERFEKIASRPPKPGREAIEKKLREWKSQRETP